jgi:hypothetical protein
MGQSWFYAFNVAIVPGTIHCDLVSMEKQVPGIEPTPCAIKKYITVTHDCSNDSNCHERLSIQISTIKWNTHSQVKCRLLDRCLQKNNVPCCFLQRNAFSKGAPAACFLAPNNPPLLPCSQLSPPLLLAIFPCLLVPSSLHKNKEAKSKQLNTRIS